PSYTNISHTRQHYIMTLQLGACIGEGGFGAVHVGIWNGQRCAVKRFYLRDQSQLIMDEVSILKNLRHRHIIQFFAVEIYEGALVLITDFAEGGSLKTAIQDKRLNGWDMKDAIAKEIARGLAYLHFNKILHRDLKSGNVLLTKHLEVKLCDFGLAQVKTSTSASQPSQRSGGSISVEGTIRWMAPELLTLHPKYSTKSDVYALGMVMWEMAAENTSPFKEQRCNELVASYVRQGAREEIPDGTPNEYKTWIVRCWDQEPSKRPEAAEMFSDDIDNVKHAPGSQFSAVSMTSTNAFSNGGQEFGPVGTLVVASPPSPNSSGSHSNQSTTLGNGAPILVKPGLPPNLHMLSQEYQERIHDILAVFDDKAELPRQVIEELRLMVVPMETLLPLVKGGDAQARYQLGLKYSQALGVEPDYKRAARLFELASGQGHHEATFQLASMYMIGNGIPLNRSKGRDLLKQAGKQGHDASEVMTRVWDRHSSFFRKSLNKHIAALQELDSKDVATASSALGTLYLTSDNSGRSNQNNIATAKFYFERALMLGDSTSAVFLGMLYEEGTGVSTDWIKARQMYAHAAARWHVHGMHKLGMMMMHGRGGVRDVEKARLWLKRAADQNSVEALTHLRNM
ncbi:hypothetical protein BGZ73_000537, partial [Actinomortierella ambigua]